MTVIEGCEMHEWEGRKERWEGGRVTMGERGKGDGEAREMEWDVRAVRRGVRGVRGRGRERRSWKRDE